MTSKVPGAHLPGFLALASYRGRKRIVDSKRHLSRAYKYLIMKGRVSMV